VAIAAAVLFGASTPVAKILLSGVDAVLLAGLLYLGSGLGLSFWWLLLKGLRVRSKKEAALRLADLPWLAAAILAGGVFAPILLMVGLNSTSASATSLLLSLEGVFTAALAWLMFKEHFDRRIVHGMISITAGCAVLSLSTKEPLLASRGSIVVIAACILWGIDNNLTRKISAGDPVEIAAAKGLIAGIVNIGVALMSGTSIPGVFTLLGSGLLGVLGYGVSLICFVLSLRRLGSARTAAYFSTAPFIGAFIGILVLGEGITVELLAGAVLMAVGVWLHITEHHHHEHGHAPFQHNHRHTHDEHHQHHDEDQLQPYGAHCHLHDHSRMLHSHPHFPDIHHRHGHSRDDAESE